MILSGERYVQNVCPVHGKPERRSPGATARCHLRIVLRVAGQAGRHADAERHRPHLLRYVAEVWALAAIAPTAALIRSHPATSTIPVMVRNHKRFQWVQIDPDRHWTEVTRDAKKVLTDISQMGGPAAPPGRQSTARTFLAATVKRLVELSATAERSRSVAPRNMPGRRSASRHASPASSRVTEAGILVSIGPAVTGGAPQWRPGWSGTDGAGPSPRPSGS